MRKIKSKQDLLGKLIKDLKPYNPERIIVFGSYARGEAKKDSDLDVLIVKKTQQNKLKRVGKVLDLLYPAKRLGKNYYSLAIDPHVYTPKEIRERLDLGDFFVSRILREGKLIYEKQ